MNDGIRVGQVGERIFFIEGRSIQALALAEPSFNSRRGHHNVGRLRLRAPVRMRLGSGRRGTDDCT